MKRLVISDSNQRRMVAKIAEEMEAADARYDGLAGAYADDVRQMHAVAIAGTDSSQIACDMLRALHFKAGNIDLFELRRFDANNLAIAMRLIECMSMPSMISDRGLGVAPDESLLLTVEQIMQMFGDEPEPRL